MPKNLSPKETTLASYLQRCSLSSYLKQVKLSESRKEKFFIRSLKHRKESTLLFQFMTGVMAHCPLKRYSEGRSND